MPVVSECDDSWLSDVLSFPLSDDDVAAALYDAAAGPVAEGCVGAGTGMACFDFKGGIGTASRRLPADAGGYTVGVLVLTNYGDREFLLIDGVPVGEAITDLMPTHHQDGSCVVVVATDAPLLPHQLRRVAQRGGHGAGGDRFVRLERQRRADARVLDREPPVVRWRGSRTVRAVADRPRRRAVAAVRRVPGHHRGHPGSGGERAAGGRDHDGQGRVDPVRDAGRSHAGADGRAGRLHA